MASLAQPLATLLAALAVAFFAYQQWKTAEKQAETALDQLRVNLFEKRFAIYEAVQALLKLLLNDSSKPEFRKFDVVPYYVKMDEAIFLFSDEICSWLKEVETDCQKFLDALESSDPKLFGACQKQLLAQLRGMPARFRNELGFRQLTRVEGPRL